MSNLILLIMFTYRQKLGLKIVFHAVAIQGQYTTNNKLKNNNSKKYCTVMFYMLCQSRIVIVGDCCRRVGENTVKVICGKQLYLCTRIELYIFLPFWMVNKVHIYRDRLASLGGLGWKQSRGLLHACICVRILFKILCIKFT